MSEREQFLYFEDDNIVINRDNIAFIAREKNPQFTEVVVHFVDGTSRILYDWTLQQLADALNKWDD